MQVTGAGPSCSSLGDREEGHSSRLREYSWALAQQGDRQDEKGQSQPRAQPRLDTMCGAAQTCGTRSGVLLPECDCDETLRLGWLETSRAI